jgi:hypothetical protein
MIIFIFLESNETSSPKKLKCQGYYANFFLKKGTFLVVLFMRTEIDQGGSTGSQILYQADISVHIHVSQFLLFHTPPPPPQKKKKEKEKKN